MPKLPPPPRRAQNRSAFSSARGAHHRALGRDDLHRHDVVAGVAEAARQVAETAAHREPADAGGRDEAEHGGQAVQLRLAVDIAQCAAGLRARGVRLRVDPHATHQRQVDHQAAFAYRQAGDVVAATPNRDQQIVLARESKCLHDVHAADAAHDQAGTAVDHAVPDLARLVVGGRAAVEHGAAEVGPEGLQRIGRDRDGAACGGGEFDVHVLLLLVGWWLGGGSACAAMLCCLTPSVRIGSCAARVQQRLLRRPKVFRHRHRPDLLAHRQADLGGIAVVNPLVDARR